MADATRTLSLLEPPYARLVPLGPAPDLRARCRAAGAALVWRMANLDTDRALVRVRDRPAGLALVVVLPPAERIASSPRLLQAIEEARPAGILPDHEVTEPQDVAQVLRRPPQDLGVEVTEYLRWRAIPIDRETVHLLRRTVELSAELRSVSALARALYLSRRALGRRLLDRGLPVPSHWLHCARLIRVCIRLQNSADSVLSVGYDLGYADGFALSNQMLRLTGFRPSDARRLLGWEWFLEAWLRREADQGGLSPEITREVLCGPRGSVVGPSDAEATRRRGRDERGRRHAVQHQSAG